MVSGVEALGAASAASGIFKDLYALAHHCATYSARVRWYRTSCKQLNEQVDEVARWLALLSESSTLQETDVERLRKAFVLAGFVFDDFSKKTPWDIFFSPLGTPKARLEEVKDAIHRAHDGITAQAFVNGESQLKRLAAIEEQLQSLLKNSPVDAEENLIYERVANEAEGGKKNPELFNKRVEIMQRSLNEQRGNNANTGATPESSFGSSMEAPAKPILLLVVTSAGSLKKQLLKIGPFSGIGEIGTSERFKIMILRNLQVSGDNHEVECLLDLSKPLSLSETNWHELAADDNAWVLVDDELASLASEVPAFRVKEKSSGDSMVVNMRGQVVASPFAMGPNAKVEGIKYDNVNYGLSGH